VGQPLVSVVTPFHNTAEYLPECIESVLNQTYGAFEYILVDNCSSDGATEIAESYTRRDSRIRFLRQSSLLPQVQNYNSALSYISRQSVYSKVVQADDYIFPDCLKLMVQAFEQSTAIGLVSAYDLKSNVVRGSGFPERRTVLSGREAAQLYLKGRAWFFGSPSTVMYRSSLVREGESFYDESRLHEDTEKCLQILEQWDFGFVHQVLSFVRSDNDSISARSRAFEPGLLDWYILVRRYAKAFFDPAEAASLDRTARRTYYRMLARRIFLGAEPAFWQYHASGLKTLPEPLDRLYLTVQICRELLQMGVNPGRTVAGLWRHARKTGKATQRSVSTERSSVPTARTPSGLSE
jgi:glycosyltransferase involved in cell wall biosynthesis